VTAMEFLSKIKKKQDTLIPVDVKQDISTTEFHNHKKSDNPRPIVLTAHLKVTFSYSPTTYSQKDFNPLNWNKELLLQTLGGDCLLPVTMYTLSSSYKDMMSLSKFFEDSKCTTTSFVYA
jgi:hypothetical protein